MKQSKKAITLYLPKVNTRQIKFLEDAGYFVTVVLSDKKRNDKKELTK